MSNKDGVFAVRKFSRRDFLKISGAGLAGSALLGVAGCGGGQQQGGADNGQLEQTTLRMAIGPDLAFAPHFVAIEKGWFEEAGFDNVEQTTFSAGVVAGEALVAGDIELWNPGNVPVTTMRANGVPVVVLGTDALARVEQLIVRPDSGIRNPEDLYGKQMGILKGSTQDAVLYNLSQHYGLDYNRLETINLEPPEAFSSLLAGDIEAMIVWAPFSWQAVQEEGMTLLHTGTVSHFEQNNEENVQISNTRNIFVVSEQFVRENPNTGKAIIEVFLRAQDYVSDPANKQEVIDTYVENSDQPRGAVEDAWQYYTFDPTVGPSYVEDMNAYANFLVETGQIRESSDLLEGTYTGYLSELRPDAVETEGKWQP